MDIKIIVLLSMIFCHIVDDYYLQGLLISMKQKSWWKEHAPDKMYRNDYKVALLMHSFSWSFMITLPAALYVHFTGGAWHLTFLLFFLANIAMHMIVDNCKANHRTINLIVDQSTHMLQILTMWLVMVAGA